MVVRPYLGKCNSTDPVTGTSINKWCVHVRVGVLGIILPNSVNTSWTRPNSDNFITITKNCQKGLSCSDEIQLVSN